MQTGTLRFAEVKLIPANSLENLLSTQPVLDGNGPDLNIRIVLPSDSRQKRDVERKLAQRVDTLKDGLIIAVAEPPLHAASALKYLIAWKWVKENIPQLSGDSYAREEVVRRISSAEKNLHSRLGGLDNLAVPNMVPLVWFGGSISKRILNPGRKLLDFSGRGMFSYILKSSVVLNELINRNIQAHLRLRHARKSRKPWQLILTWKILGWTIAGVQRKWRYIFQWFVTAVSMFVVRTWEDGFLDCPPRNGTSVRCFRPLMRSLTCLTPVPMMQWYRLPKSSKCCPRRLTVLERV